MTNPKPHSIAVVVDPNFGLKLIELSSRIHTWVCGSDINKVAAEQILADTKPDTNPFESGVSTFKYEPNDTVENIFLDVLATVDDHHNHDSHDPAWTTMEVYGVSLTPDIRDALSSDYGCNDFSEIETGFVAKRKIWDSLH
jgi:hypothetical protein